MTKQRIKVKLPTIATLEQAEAAMNELVSAENDRRKIVAARDSEILIINESFGPDITQLEELVAEKTNALRAWAEANPDVFPKNRKSLDLNSGVLGFRTGTPKLALLSRAWTWAKVIAAVQDAGFAFFVRTKEELDKDAIIAEVRAGRSGLATQIGVKVVQDESFFIEPKLTDTDARQVEKV